MRLGPPTPRRHYSARPSQALPLPRSQARYGARQRHNHRPFRPVHPCFQLLPPGTRLQPGLCILVAAARRGCAQMRPTHIAPRGELLLSHAQHRLACGSRSSLPHPPTPRSQTCGGVGAISRAGPMAQPPWHHAESVTSTYLASRMNSSPAVSPPPNKSMGRGGMVLESYTKRPPTVRTLSWYMSHRWSKCCSCPFTELGCGVILPWPCGRTSSHYLPSQSQTPHAQHLVLYTPW